MTILTTNNNNLISNSPKSPKSSKSQMIDDTIIKKKKKRRSYKSLIRKIMKCKKKTKEQQLKDHQNQIKQSLGGGKFEKLVDRL